MYNHQLDTFVKVAESGSFSKAAAGLYISSTATIQQINLLEERCGFKLFIRSSHGVKLTAAGKSLYDDVKTLIKLSNDSLAKASRLAETSETTVRIATTLLYKCRLLPNIWTKINEQYPELKIEILPMTSNQGQNTTFSLLGTKYDMFEGIYGTKGWKGKCNFLELTRTPICFAVAKNHRLAEEKSLSLEDLNGEYVVMPIEGVSYGLDALRAEINKNYPHNRHNRFFILRLRHIYNVRGKSLHINNTKSLLRYTYELGNNPVETGANYVLWHNLLQKSNPGNSKIYYRHTKYYFDIREQSINYYFKCKE